MVLTDAQAQSAQFASDGIQAGVNRYMDFLEERKDTLNKVSSRHVDYVDAINEYMGGKEHALRLWKELTRTAMRAGASRQR